MRLAFVADPASLHTNRWVAWFARAGHDVRLVDAYGTGPEPEVPDGVRLERPDRPPTRLPLRPRPDGAEPLGKLLRDIGADLVHAHFVRRHGWSAARAGQRPLVMTPWGSDILRAPWWKVRTRLWNRFALRSADLVTVSSEGMRLAAERSGADPARIELVNHGVETDRFAPGPRDEDMAARLGADDGPIVVSPRSIRPLYRQATVVRAVAEAGRRTGTRPMLVMSARGADAGELRRVRAAASAAGIGDRLRILEGLAHHELPALLRLADVVVSVPETDSFPLSMLEAMACGTPVVASDVPAVTPVYAPLSPIAGELIVPVGDATATARAIERAMALSPDERAQLGALLRGFVLRSADYETNMRRMEQLYRHLATPQ